MPIALDPRPARPLTTREIVKVLSGTVGGLIDFCDINDVREAVRWIAETDAFWRMLGQKPKG